MTNISNLWQKYCAIPNSDQKWWLTNWPVTFANDLFDCNSTSLIQNNFGDNDYNVAFSNLYNSAHYDIANKIIYDGVEPSSPVEIKIANLKRPTNEHFGYDVQWFWTWSDCPNADSCIEGREAGTVFIPRINELPQEINRYYSVELDSSVTILAPPTIKYNFKEYPGDWAFIMRYVPEPENIAKHNSANFCQPKEIIIAEPNPTNGLVWIQKNNVDSPCNISVFNSNGDLIQSEYDVLLNVIRLDFTTLPNGVYHVHIQDNMISKVLKIIKI